MFLCFRATPEHSSLFSNGQGPSPPSRSAVGLGFSTSRSEYDEIDPDQPLSTLEVQPPMLAVDLSLSPGESRTCMCFVVPAHQSNSMVMCDPTS